ncbi:MAG: type I-E CRISPR-associated protein Cse1/CasA [Thermomicrobiales bacterium]
MANFNLVDEPWVPCLMGTSPATATELNVRDTLVRAPEIREIAGETPLVTIALHRLLLAIVHRCIGPLDVATWRHWWEARAWDATLIDDYLRAWRHRFDLFDEERPFYQTAAVDFSRGLWPLTRNFLLSKKALFFDHDLESMPAAVSPAEAVRLLVAFQWFDVGGIKSAEQDKDFADASPLTQCAVGLVRGENLFRTLMLNLHRYAPRQGMPFDFDAERDAPAWERDEAARPEDRAPDGYLDYLTWQSRRLRLLPEFDADGKVVVRQSVIMKGFQLPDLEARRRAETMVAFRRNPNAKGSQDPWPAIGFQEEKALWRDSLAFFQSIHERYTRPRMVNWLNELAEAEVLHRREIVPMDFYGLAVDRANALFWRQERLILPLLYLDKPELFHRLGDALALAENVAQLCRSGYVDIEVDGKTRKPPSPFRVMAGLLVGADGPVGDVVSHLAPERVYWSALDLPFRRLIVDLADDVAFDAEGDEVYGTRALPHWGVDVAEAARAAFAAATDGLDGSARSLKAAAVGEREFRWLLNRILDRPGVSAGADAAVVGGAR